MTWTEHAVPFARHCPHCDQKITAEVTITESQAPAKPGDLAICNGCGTVMAWSATMHLRKLTPEEKHFAGRSAVIQAAQHTIRTRHSLT